MVFYDCFFSATSIITLSSAAMHTYDSNFFEPEAAHTHALLLRHLDLLAFQPQVRRRCRRWLCYSKVESEVGGKCALQLPPAEHRTALHVTNSAGTAVPVQHTGLLWTFATRAGETYTATVVT